MNIFPCTYYIYLSGPWKSERVNSPLYNLVPIILEVIFWMMNCFFYNKILKDAFNAQGAEHTTTRDFFVSSGATLSVNHVNPQEKLWV